MEVGVLAHFETRPGSALEVRRFLETALAIKELGIPLRFPVSPAPIRA